ncbi:MAG: gamma-glutamyltransferase, partial [Solirubrobacterales bacterium]
MAHGAVAAGHPLTAEAGAGVLREGGNAVDAAVCAMLVSSMTESPRSGLGAGGFMLVHDPPRSVLLDFFVETPGRARSEPTEELLPITIDFEDTEQVFNVGAAACGVPGTPAGVVEAVSRFGSVPIERLAAPAIAAAREGVPVNEQQAYVLALLDSLHDHHDETRDLYSRRGRPLAEGDLFRFPDLADSLELLATEGSVPFYRGEIAARISEWVLDRGGTLAPEDLAAYEVVDREPVSAEYRGLQVLSNPPPSSGGVLIAYALELLDRLGSAAVPDVVRAMAAAQSVRTPEFEAG